MSINMSAPAGSAASSASYSIPVSALANGYAVTHVRSDAAAQQPVHTLTFTVGQSLEEVERAMIIKTMQVTRGNRTRAAQILGISVRTLYTKLLAIEPKSAPALTPAPAAPAPVGV